MDNQALIPENINLNQYNETLDSCLKRTSEFGGTLYQNICNGESYYIANGFWDITIGVVLAFIGIGVAIFFFSIIFD